MDQPYDLWIRHLVQFTRKDALKLGSRKSTPDGPIDSSKETASGNLKGENFRETPVLLDSQIYCRVSRVFLMSRESRLGFLC